MIKFFLDGVEQTTQYGYEYLDKEFWFIINLQMEGSSGSPGPDGGESVSSSGGLIRVG